jgi:hypothetical protein
VDSLVAYRVSFKGTDLTAAAAAWEGSASGPGRPSRHRALIKASSAQDAIAGVAGALTGHGSFADFDASPVTDSRGERWRGSLSRSWSQVDWQSDPRLAELSELERAVLGCLADAAEPTWIVLSALAEPIDPRAVENVLEALERQGLVYSTLEQSGEPGRESEPCRWWAMTGECWDLLGLIKSPMYR